MASDPDDRALPVGLDLNPKLPQRNVVVDSLLSIGSALVVGLGVLLAFRDRGKGDGNHDA